MKDRNYPPGAKSALRAYFGLYRDPLSFLMQTAQEYGDVVHLRVGKRHDYLINHPDYIRSVLLAGEEDMLRSFSRPMKAVLGNGLLSSQGTYHRRQRRLIQPSFHHQHVTACARVITEYASWFAESWKSGEEIDVFAAMLRLTMAIVLKVLFNIDSEDQADEMGRLLEVVMERTHKRTVPFVEEFVGKLPLPANLRYRRARQQLDAIMYRIIEERRASGSERPDFLSQLLRLQDAEDGARGLTDQEVRDEAMTMFGAGHETMGSALSWTWYLLAQHPEVEERMQSELREVLAGRTPTAEDLPRLPYTAMIFNEVMRLYPPVWLMVRRPTRDFPLGDYVVPANCYLHISQYLMHRDSRYFPEPDRFDPERWRPEAVAARPKFSYFPFGAGSRKCIGEGFAWMEALLVVATLGQNWSMRLVPGHRVELQPMITLRPKYGIIMKLHRRTGEALQRSASASHAG